MVNKTLTVDIRKDMDSQKIISEINKHLKPCLEVKITYVVKTAYSTNRDNLKFAENEDDVKSKKVLI
jgi:hypothetical protein